MRRPLALPALLALVIALAGVVALLLPLQGRDAGQLPPAADSAPAATASVSSADLSPAATPPPPPATREPPSPTAPPTPTSAPPSPTVSPPLPTATAEPAEVRYSYPIGIPGRPLGDGFVIRHGAQVENTWYNPGHWHTGEDWYALEGDTGGAAVFAVAAGEVVYAGANYPGRVVLIAHPDGLVSMYGHLDPQLAVAVGDRVARGQRLGTVLAQVGARAPSHLHFELRTFVTAEEVNGARPRYSFRCGISCPPGPGYWPLGAPDLPVEQGWRNPTHLIARRMVEAEPGGRLGEVVAATAPASATVTLWSGPPDDPARRELAEVSPAAGERLPLLAVWAGEEAPRETSALAYRLWYRVRLADGREGWVQAAVATGAETGSDGRPSSVGFNFFPMAEAAPAKP